MCFEPYGYYYPLFENFDMNISHVLKIPADRILKLIEIFCKLEIIDENLLYKEGIITSVELQQEFIKDQELMKRDLKEIPVKEHNLLNIKDNNNDSSDSKKNRINPFIAAKNRKKVTQLNSINSKTINPDVIDSETINPDVIDSETNAIDSNSFRKNAIDSETTETNKTINSFRKNAIDSETNAINSETNAINSETNAINSETNAINSETINPDVIDSETNEQRREEKRREEKRRENIYTSSSSQLRCENQNDDEEVFIKEWIEYFCYRFPEFTEEDIYDLIKSFPKADYRQCGEAYKVAKIEHTISKPKSYLINIFKNDHRDALKFEAELANPVTAAKKTKEEEEMEKYYTNGAFDPYKAMGLKDL